MSDSMGLQTDAEDLDKALADVSNQEEEGKETPAESSTAENQEGEAESSTAEDKTEENVPFHMTDFWKRQQAKHEEEMTALREELATLKSSGQPQKPSVSPDAMVQDIYVDREDGPAKAQAFREQLIAEAEERALRKLEERQAQAEAYKRQADEWLDTTLQDLKSKHGTFDENALFKIVEEENLVKIEDGIPRWNLEAGLKMLQLQEAKDPAKTRARKMVADASVSGSKGESQKKSRFTLEEIRKHGATPDWESLGF